MDLKPNNQTKLYGLKDNLDKFITLYKTNKLPNKILLSGSKGIGKATMAYHLVNFILSQDEQFSYDEENNSINLENKSFKLIQNKSNPNFNLIDINDEKQKIDIAQIRKLITNLNMSTFNNKPKIVLIDNIEFLNKNSINSLLKVIEEPSDNTFFILINNDKNILPTLKSRCLNFKVVLSNEKSKEIINKILDNDISKIINKDLLDFYFTPGKIFNLIKFSKENSIELKDIKLNQFLSLIIDKDYFKKGNLVKYNIYDFFELFLCKNISLEYSYFYSYFLKQFDNVRKFNLDEESVLIEFKHKFLNG
tara:strand:- start:13 stop:933 length:921 start_codon:yes stop_codon:yes gene_type:complete